MDITQLILDDHHEQRPVRDLGAGRAHGHRCAVGGVGPAGHVPGTARGGGGGDLLSRAAASGPGRRPGAGTEGETLDAIGDHNDIRDAVAEVAHHQAGSDGWFAAVAAANLANSDHMAEEEREGLTDFRRLAGLQQRHDLAVAFAAFQARNFAGVPAVDTDPESYVRQAEQDLRPRATGSLNIGSLKEQ